jgi:hypothetical protein
MKRVHPSVAVARALLFTGACALLPGFASAQSQGSLPAETISPLQVSIACSLPPAMTLARVTTPRSTAPLHVIGAQDPVSRSLFDEHDLLIIDGGTGRGVELGQQYFVRRPVSLAVFRGEAKAVVTGGWIRIIAVNQTTAIAAVDRICGPIQSGDYLEPFVLPSVPSAAVAVDRSGDPDFSTLGRILFGEQESYAAGAGSYIMIDRGTDQGLTPGARFAIYRDVKDWMQTAYGRTKATTPLTAIGEGVVVTTGETMSVMKILEARDAVQRGDYVVPRLNAKR